MAEVAETRDVLMDNSENYEFNDNDNRMEDNTYSHCCGSQETFHNKLIFYDDNLQTLISLKEDDDSNGESNEEGIRVRFLYNHTSVHAIRESKKKCLKLEGNHSIVVSPLEGDNANLELRLIVNTYLENLNDNKRPVTLGIAGQNLYLCCTAQGIADQLPSLIEVDNIKEKRAEDELLPLMFYYRKDASLFSFESAAFPGYYLSASQNDGDKLQLMPKSEVFVTEFILTPRLA